MPWNPTTKKMSLPISLADIAAAVGYYGPDLIGNGTIIKWQKFKPIRSADEDYYATQGNPTTEQWKPDATWWIGPHTITENGVTYYTIASMRIPVAQGVIGSITSGFIRSLADGLMGWTYFRPLWCDVANSIQRVFDFLQYNGNCISPLPTTPAATMEGYEPTTGASTMIGVIPTITEVGNLTLTDMVIPNELITTQPNLSQFYLGMLFYNPAKTEAYWCTARNPLNNPTDNKNINVPFVFPTTLRGKFYARSFLSRDPLTQNENPYNGFYIGGAEEERTMIIAPSNVIGTANFDIITAKWISTMNPAQLNARIEAYNYKNTIVSASVVMELVNPLTSEVIDSRTYPAQIIDSGESVIIGGPWNVQFYEDNAYLRVVVTFNGTPIIKTSNIDPV